MPLLLWQGLWMHNHSAMALAASGAGKGPGYRANSNLKRKVLDFIQFGGPGWDRTNDQPVMSRLLYH